jgi:Bacterial dnaA protein helix-turn-helix
VRAGWEALEQVRVSRIEHIGDCTLYLGDSMTGPKTAAELRAHYSAVRSRLGVLPPDHAKKQALRRLRLAKHYRPYVEPEIVKPVLVAPIEFFEPELWQAKYTLQRIAAAVCDVTGITPMDFRSERRPLDVAVARQIYFWLGRYLTPWSFGIIGSRAGNRDHTTVLHGAKKINADLLRYGGTISRVLAVLEGRG